MGLVQKSFSDIITFSRSSNATRVGPTGLVQYAPHNLLTYSEQFDNAAWGKDKVSVVANATAAPNGTVTADKLVEDTATGAHAINSATITPVANQTYTASAYIKAGERTFCLFNLFLGGINTYAYVNLTTGAITGVTGSGLFSATSVGNGWWRCIVTLTTSNTNAGALYIYTANNTPAFSYTGDGTSGIYLWGAQLSVGPYALDYTPTTSAAVYGPRFDYNGSGVTIVEPVSRNLLTYSEQFDNAAWGKSDASVTANTTSSPDGTVTADTLAATAPGYASTFRTETVVSGNAYTLSVYAKANVSSTLSLEFRGSGSSPDATFNLSNGTVASGTGVISAVGNGWYRCSITKAAVDTSEIVIIGLGTSATIGNSIYLWGAQLEVGSTATGYMVSGATNGFRAVPVVSGSATARGLLVEEQRQNLFVQSNDFSTTWLTFQSAVTTNSTTAPDGTVTADTIASNITGVASVVYQLSVGSAATHTVSVYAKKSTSDWFQINFEETPQKVAWFNLNTGVVGTVDSGVTASIQSAGNGWYRCTSTFTMTAAKTISMGPCDADASRAATSGKSVYVWGAQLEAGSFATSYIPTVASTATRSADVASVNTLSPWFNATEGTLFSEHDFIGFNSNTQAAAVLVNAATTNYVLIYKNTSGSNSVEINSGASTQATFTLGTSAVNTNYKISGVYKVNDFAAVQNGGAVQTDTSGAVPVSIEYLGLGYVASGAPLQINGHLRRVAYYPRRLTNAELQALTA